MPPDRAPRARATVALRRRARSGPRARRAAPRDGSRSPRSGCSAHPIIPDLAPIGCIDEAIAYLGVPRSRRGTSLASLSGQGEQTMKILSIKRLIGLAAVYGAVQYARKHGGPKNAFNELLGKAKDLAGQVKDEVGNVAGTSDVSSTSSGIGSKSTYGSSSSSSYSSGL